MKSRETKSHKIVVAFLPPPPFAPLAPKDAVGQYEIEDWVAGHLQSLIESAGQEWVVVSHSVTPIGQHLLASIVLGLP